MKRQISTIPHALTCSCCPGHDKWPHQTYKSRRSKAARARDIKKEHRYVRRVLNQQIKKEETKEENE
jgi:hypothetical protein